MGSRFCSRREGKGGGGVDWNGGEGIKKKREIHVIINLGYCDCDE